ncbi:MAG: SRPBCC domain-containing protein [Actinomycetota bacterium]
MDRTIAASPETVFDLLTTPDGLVRWWPSTADIDLRVGGAYHFHWEGPDVHLRGEVTAVEAPSLFAYTWSWDHEETPPGDVRIELRDEDGSTALHLEHTASTTDEAGDHRAGWEHFLARLAEVAEEPR